MEAVDMSHAREWLKTKKLPSSSNQLSQMTRVSVCLLQKKRN